MRARYLSGLGVCQTNCYVVISEQNNAVLIDAPDDYDAIAKALDGTHLTDIILTHGHFDHIYSVAELVKLTGATVHIHENDLRKLTDSYQNLAAVFGLEKNFVNIDEAVTFTDGDIIKCDELEFKVMHTPGHTSGSVCFFLEDNVFTGDTLFRGSRGRTDLLDASLEKMNLSLKRLRDFEGEYEDYHIFAGHGKPSKLSEEKQNNVYLLGFDYDDMF